MSAEDRGPIREQHVLDHRYLIIERIAHGGSATVWRALDERLSRPVAVKVLNETLPDTAREQLVAEAQLLARLSHPNLATVHDVAVADGVAYLVMELVEGRS